MHHNLSREDAETLQEFVFSLIQSGEYVRQTIPYRLAVIAAALNYSCYHDSEFVRDVADLAHVLETTGLKSDVHAAILGHLEEIRPGYFYDKDKLRNLPDGRTVGFYRKGDASRFDSFNRKCASILSLKIGEFAEIRSIFDAYLNEKNRIEKALARQKKREQAKAMQIAVALSLAGKGGPIT
jgi:hypothetical protein